MTPGAAGDRARTWADSGLVDLEFYGALRDRSFEDVVDAAVDFVTVGMRERLSTHPFLDFHSLPPEARKAWRQQEVERVLEHLREGAAHTPRGPLADHADPDQVRRMMLEAAGKLVAGADGWVVEPQESATPDTSVVVVASSLQPAARAVHRVREESPEGVEIVVVDHGIPTHAALGLHARLIRDEARAVRVPATGSAEAALARGMSLARADRLVVLPPHLLVRPGWLEPLMEALEEDVAATPLVLDELDLVAHEGGLRGHPPEDVDRLPTDRLTGEPDMYAQRAGERPGRVRLVPRSRVTTLGGVSSARLPAATVADRAPGGRRWSLQLPSPPGFRGDRWGDTYFAGALARSLRRLGEDVVTRRRGAHDAGPVELDDVHLAIRGLHRITPTPGVVNVLWVISHPDDVRLDELEGYDVVCAASVPWSEQLAERSGRPVVPLLQASEFVAPDAAAGREPAVVFVGNADPRRDRPMVWRTLEAGVPLAVYGRGWEALPPGVWCGQHVDNALLPELYRRHGVVLADHWPDMAEQGFVANRVFDAVAAGARVVSDQVAGLAEVFSPEVVAEATTPAGLAAAVTRLRAAGDVAEPSTPVSFDDRARTLHALVRSL